MMMNNREKSDDLPNFKDMPPVKGMPHGCAWGLFDRNGEVDHLGTLNHLSEEVVRGAKEEIQNGVSVSLDCSLDDIGYPGFGRPATEHKMISFTPMNIFAWDDTVTFNTQQGSQWDGLRHFAHQETGLHYNGRPHKDLENTDEIGINYWLKRGGIVGRGVLLDYASWADKNGIKYEVNTRHEIKVQHLKQIARDTGVELKKGDILIVRSGFMRWHNGATDEQKIETVQKGGPVVGVGVDDELLAWLWDSHFSAIAGDTIGFEAMPFGDTWLHTYALAMWGMPIGELWNLEKLAEECIRQQRWSFFLTSAPLNIRGGVASPPNALAIF